MPGAVASSARPWGHLTWKAFGPTPRTRSRCGPPNQFGTIMLRFVGLLAVAIAILAFVYSR
jgi:hypothetical protein